MMTSNWRGGVGGVMDGTAVNISPQQYLISLIIISTIMTPEVAISY